MDAFIDLGSVGKDPYDRGRSSSYRTGYQIGKIFGYIMVIAIAIFVVIRLVRRSYNKP
jgi:hypothetical protein